MPDVHHGFDTGIGVHDVPDHPVQEVVVAHRGCVDGVLPLPPAPVPERIVSLGVARRSVGNMVVPDHRRGNDERRRPQGEPRPVPIRRVHGSHEAIEVRGRILASAVMDENHQLHSRVGVPHHVVSAVIGQDVLLPIYCDGEVEPGVLLLGPERLHNKESQEDRHHVLSHDCLLWR